MPDPAQSIKDVVDWNFALEAVGSDPQLLRDVIDAFLLEAPQKMDSLRLALQTGDATTFHRAAHTLKGSARYFGARRVVEAARQLEILGEAAKAGDGTLDAAPPLVEQLQELVAELTTPLAAYVRKGS